MHTIRRVSIFLIVIILFTIIAGIYYMRRLSLSSEKLAIKNKIPYPAVIAHRGASIVAPESTYPAYVEARDLGSDYLEVDLQRTKDGEIIIFHDEHLRRTSNVEEIFPDRADEEIGSFTYEELKQLDFGSWFNETNPRYARDEYEGLDISL